MALILEINTALLKSFTLTSMFVVVMYIIEEYICIS